MLDESLLLTKGVRIRHVAHVVDVACVFLVIGVPLPVLLVDGQGDLFEVEGSLHGIEKLEELLKIFLVYEFIAPVTWLALGGGRNHIKKKGQVNDVGRQNTP